MKRRKTRTTTTTRRSSRSKVERERTARDGREPRKVIEMARKGKIVIDADGTPLFMGYDEDDLGDEYEFEGDEDEEYEDELLGMDDELGAYRRYRRLRRKPGRPRPVYRFPPGGGLRQRPGKYPNLRPVVRESTKAKYIGHKQSLTAVDNDISGSGGALVANTANNWSTIFEAVVPQNRKWHFRPQNIRGRDANIPSFAMLLYDQQSTPELLTGKYQILLWNSARNNIRAVIASGALAEFGIGTNIDVSLTDINKRVYYLYDVIAGQGDIVQVQVYSSSVLDTSNSDLVLEFIELAP